MSFQVRNKQTKLNNAKVIEYKNILPLFFISSDIFKSRIRRKKGIFIKELEININAKKTILSLMKNPFKISGERYLIEFVPQNGGFPDSK